MKKIYTLFITSIIGSAAFAQCVVNPALFGGPNNTNYAIIPNTTTNLPLAYVGTGYSADLQFHIQPDTTVTSPIPGTFDITQIKIDSISGIPPNFYYLANRANGIFTTTTATPPGTGYGCVGLTGTAAPGQELGGPGGNGIYPMTVYFTATVVVFSIPAPQASSYTGYQLHILPASGLNSLNAGIFSVSASLPNPANEQAEFILNSPVGGTVQFSMYNMLGSIVKQETVSTTAGTNNYFLKTAYLSSGVYMCSFRMNDALITRRITVSH